MAISASLGTAGLKQGVCTSTTRPTGPYEGQMIYETDTDLTYVYNGSSWQQVSGGTAVGNSGLVTIASGTATAGTLIIAGAFSSTYDSYRLVINASGSSSGEISAQFRVGTTTSNNSYNWALWGSLDSGTASNYAATNQSFLTTTYGIGSCVLDIFAPYLAQETWYAGTQVMNAFGTYYNRQIGGRHTQTTSYDQLVIVVPASVTIRYSLMGYRK